MFLVSSRQHSPQCLSLGPQIAYFPEPCGTRQLSRPSELSQAPLDTTNSWRADALPRSEAKVVVPGAALVAHDHSVRSGSAATTGTDYLFPSGAEPVSRLQGRLVSPRHDMGTSLDGAEVRIPRHTLPPRAVVGTDGVGRQPGEEACG